MTENDDDLRSQIIDDDCPDSGPILIKLSDVGGPPSDREIRRIRENAYRRGFVQGWAAAARAMRGGYTVRTIELHCDDLHRQWRNKTHGGKVEFPPELP